MKNSLALGLALLGVLAFKAPVDSAQPVPGSPPPVPGGPPPVPLPPPMPVPPARPPTIFEFARAVQPLPGKYDVTLIHPYTKCPVRVCFDLPPGCPKVIVRKKLLCYEIDFDYGRFEIELNFGCRGRVRVDRN